MPVTPNQASPNRSTKSGTKPSVPVRASTLETKQLANARAHERDNMRIHLRLQDNGRTIATPAVHEPWPGPSSPRTLPPRCSIGRQSQCRQQPIGNDLPPTVLSGFLHSCTVEHCPIGVRCIGERETCSSGRTTQRDVDG